MKHYNIFKLFIRYLYDHLRIIVYFLITVSVFLIVLYLYGVPLEPLLYATVLSGSIGSVSLAINFIRYFKKYTMLIHLKNEVTYSIENLPKGDTLTEIAYTQLITNIYNDNLNYKNTMERNQSDMLDYYTMWVHQIKTPISAIRLLLQVEDYSNTKELQNELFKIEQYVNMVLSYLRIDSTTTDFLIKPYSLDTIVKKSIRKYSKSFILKKISIQLDSICCNVVTDEKWISFVIEQILSNSLKYTNTGGKVHIYENSNRLYIQDNGIGISPEDLPRIFDKGFTGYNGRLDKKSTGIGLYLCKKILNKLNHKIEISSNIGTVVTIDFNTHTEIKD